MNIATGCFKSVMWVGLCVPLALAAAQTESATSKSFAVTAGSTLEVSVSGSDIVINAWEKNEIFVRAEGIDPEDVRWLKMSQTGNTVRVEYRPRGEDSSHGRFQISAPGRCNLDLRTSGGDVTLEGTFSGALKGSTSGGDITVADVDGTITMRTSGGDIRAGKIDGEASMKTSGGDISVQTAGGNVDVSTSGGDVRVGAVGKMLRASTSGGDIQVGDIGGEATVSTSGGDIKLGKVSGNATVSTSGGDIVLDGASGRVSARTSGGDLALYNVSGSLDGATSGGDIQAELQPSGTGTSSLRTSGGSIRLALPESSKATIEALIRLEGRRSKTYDVRSDFKPEQHDKNEDEVRATFKLNGGGETIPLETVNGNIEIRKLTGR